nr:phosphoribosylformylglycinamidine synthase subunit PurQ [Leptospirillum ferriphilum]
MKTQPNVRSQKEQEFYSPPPIRVGIVQFPGTNCDFDTWEAVRSVSGLEPSWLSYQTDSVREIDAVILPGGFSYGDYLRTGAMAAQTPVMKAIRKFAQEGHPVLGICNGFQILVETGLLPGALLINASRSFICEDSPVVSLTSRTPFTSIIPEGTRITLPIAHQEGRYYLPEDKLRNIEASGQVVFRYANNPNGSIHDIAGVSNPEGNVVGLMPHPERRIRHSSSPPDGLLFFESLLISLRNRMFQRTAPDLPLLK